MEALMKDQSSKQAMWMDGMEDDFVRTLEEFKFLK